MIFLNSFFYVQDSIRNNKWHEIRDFYTEKYAKYLSISIGSNCLNNKQNA